VRGTDDVLAASRLNFEVFFFPLFFLFFSDGSMSGGSLSSPFFFFFPFSLQISGNLGKRKQGGAKMN